MTVNVRMFIPSFQHGHKTISNSYLYVIMLCLYINYEYKSKLFKQITLENFKTCTAVTALPYIYIQFRPGSRLGQSRLYSALRFLLLDW
jgi:hypothetical protein